MTALITINQATRPAGVAGKSRSDGVTTQLVTCTNGSVASSYLWTLVDVPIRSALTRGITGTGASFTFTPDVKGTYAVTLRTNGSSASSENDNVYIAVRSSALGWRYQAAGETDEDNEDYVGLGFVDNINPRGWSTNQDLITEEVEAGIAEVEGAVSSYAGLVERIVKTEASTGLISSTLLPGGGGGVTDLQGAYDGGPDITEGLSGILIAQGSGSPTDNYVLRLESGMGSSPLNVLMIARSPTTSGGGAGVSISMGANAAGDGVSVTHLGSGAGLTVDATGGSGLGISSLVAAGQIPFQSQVNAINALTVDGGASAVFIGESTTPFLIMGYGVCRMGSAATSSIKSFEAYTTAPGGGGDPIDVNNLGRIIMRPGTHTAASTVADLHFRAGSAGESQLTKGGRLYASTTIREYLIANGVTLAAGDVVRPASATTIGKASASSLPAIGIVLVGGVGDGSTVYALVATGGYVSGLSGLTTGGAVYLGASAGTYATTAPTGAGESEQRLGLAISTSEMIVAIEAPLTPFSAPAAVTAASAALTGDFIRVDTTSNNVTLTLGTAVTRAGFLGTIRKINSGTNKITLDPVTQSINGGTGGVSVDLPDSDAPDFPSWSVYRDDAGDIWVT